MRGRGHIAQIGRAIPLGRGVEAHEDDIHPFDDLGQVGGEEEVTAAGFVHGRNQPRLVHIPLNRLPLARAVCFNALFINVICDDFVSIFGTNGRVGQPHKARSNDDNFHVGKSPF